MAHMSLHICAVLSEPALLTNTKYGSGERLRPNCRPLAPLNMSEWAFKGGLLCLCDSTVKPVLSWNTKNWISIPIIAKCRSIVLQNAPVEHPAILLTFIKLLFSVKTIVLSIFKWLLKTGLIVPKSCAVQLIVGVLSLDKLTL